MKKTKLIVATFLRPDSFYPEGYRLRHTVGESSRHPDNCKWNQDDEIFLFEEEIEIVQHDFDVREVLLAQARGELEALRAEFSVKEMKLEQRINELLALEFQS
jgi:hypothetical protein